MVGFDEVVERHQLHVVFLDQRLLASHQVAQLDLLHIVALGEDDDAQRAAETRVQRVLQLRQARALHHQDFAMLLLDDVRDLGTVAVAGNKHDGTTDTREAQNGFL
jgi:hypothetical protein